MTDYEITEETYLRLDGTRYKIQQILEKGTCRIVGRRIVELPESEQLKELLRRVHLDG